MRNTAQTIERKTTNRRRTRMSLPRAVQRRPALFRLREKDSSLRSNALTVTNPIQIAKRLNAMKSISIKEPTSEYRED